MFNILEEFANDGIHPNSRYFMHNSEFAGVMGQVTDAENALNAVLDETGKKLMENFIKAQDKLNYLSNTDKFIYGYRLGVLMTAEVFRTSDDTVTGGERR